MESIGYVLELLYTARTSFSSIRVAGRTWYDEERYSEAMRRWEARQEPGATAILRGLGDSPPQPQHKEWVSRL